MAVTEDLSLNQVSDRAPSYISVPVAAATVLPMGIMVCALLASGYVVPAGTAGTGPVLGVTAFRVDTTGLANGARNVHVLQGTFVRPNSSVNPVTELHLGRTVYAEDEQTIGSKPGAGVPAGVCCGLDADGDVIVGFGLNLGCAQQSADVSIPIGGAILAAGTPMAAFADNSASNPGVSLVNSKAYGIRWNNAASQVAVFGSFCLPNDIDLTNPVTIKARCSKVGATAADLTTFDIALFPQTTAALHDAATSAGGTTTACANLATKTVQEVTLEVDETKLGTAGDVVTFSIKPTDGTLGTDDMVLHGLKLVYRRKQLLA